MIKSIVENIIGMIFIASAAAKLLILLAQFSFNFDFRVGLMLFKDITSSSEVC
jgi:hypothetical protein